MTYRDLSPEDAHAEIQANPDLKVLDVRTVMEHELYHIDGSQLLPIQELEMRLDEIDPRFDYLIYCEHGIRSAAACEYLATQGFVNLRNVIGGMVAWIGAGLPHNR